MVLCVYDVYTFIRVKLFLKWLLYIAYKKESLISPNLYLELKWRFYYHRPTQLQLCEF